MDQKKRGPKVRLKPIKCKNCAQFFQPDRKIKTYCSVKCWKEGEKTTRFKICKNCKKSFLEPHLRKDIVFCSMNCRKGFNTTKFMSNSENQRRHFWIKRFYGKANQCWNFNKQFFVFSCNGVHKRFEWANKSNEYKLEQSDWYMLCSYCHKNLDILKILKVNYLLCYSEVRRS